MINGRQVEADIVKYLKQANRKWLVHHFNEHKWHKNATPADVMLGTSRYNVLIESKATETHQIRKNNIRTSQLASLRKHSLLRKSNISLLCFYFQRSSRYFLVNIDDYSKLPNSITPYSLKNIGIIVKQWYDIPKYLRQLCS